MEIIDLNKLPIFHFLKELRVTNFHLKSIESDNSKSTCYIKNLDLEFDLNPFIVANCNLDLFINNNNYAKHYNTTEFAQTVKWEQKIRYNGVLIAS